MLGKLGQFFKDFGRNVAADPVGSLKGLVQLAAAGAISYGMATGKIAPDETHIGVTSALAASGIHALGTDSTGKTSATAEKLAEAVQVAGAAAPAALTTADHFEALRKEAGAAQASLIALSDMAAALYATTGAGATPPPAAAQEEAKPGGESEAAGLVAKAVTLAGDADELAGSVIAGNQV